MRTRRRVLAGLGVGALAGLSGCGALFTSPDTEPAASPSETFSATSPTPTIADSPSSPTSTPTSAGTIVDLVGHRLSLRPSDGLYNTLVTVTVDFRNAGDRGLSLVTLRVALRYTAAGANRVVAVDYVGDRFGGSGLAPGGSESVGYETAFPRDGRADRSTDPDDFDIDARVQRIEFV